MTSGGSGEKPGSLTLGGAVSHGTGVMLGAGTFALTEQVADRSDRSNAPACAYPADLPTAKGHPPIAAN